MLGKFPTNQSDDWRFQSRPWVPFSPDPGVRSIPTLGPVQSRPWGPFNPDPGSRSSKVPSTVRTRQAIWKTMTHLPWKADLLACVIRENKTITKFHGLKCFRFQDTRRFISSEKLRDFSKHRPLARQRVFLCHCCGHTSLTSTNAQKGIWRNIISTSFYHSATEGACFWDYSGIWTLRIDGTSVLLRAIPISE